MLNNMFSRPRNDAELETFMKHLNKVNQHHLKVSLSESRSNKLRDYACAMLGFSDGYQAISEFWKTEARYPFDNSDLVVTMVGLGYDMMVVFAKAVATQVLDIMSRDGAIMLNDIEKGNDFPSRWRIVDPRVARDEVLRKIVENGYPVMVGDVQVGVAENEKVAYLLSLVLAQDETMVLGVDGSALLGSQLQNKSRTEMTSTEVFSRYVFQQKGLAPVRSPLTRYIELFPFETDEYELLDIGYEPGVDDLGMGWIHAGVKLPFESLSIERGVMHIKNGDITFTLHTDRKWISDKDIHAVVIEDFLSHFCGVVRIVDENAPMTLDVGETDEDGNRHVLESERSKHSVLQWECGFDYPCSKMHVKHETIELVADDREGTWLHDEDRGDIEIFCTIS